MPGAAMALVALAYAETQYGDKSAAQPLLRQAREIFAALGATARVDWIDQQLAEL